MKQEVGFSRTKRTCFNMTNVADVEALGVGDLFQRHVMDLQYESNGNIQLRSVIWTLPYQ